MFINTTHVQSIDNERYYQAAAAAANNQY